MKNSLDRGERLAIVSENLRALREKMYPGHGGKKQLADAMGLTIQQWSPWEKGLRMPSSIRLEKIAEFFNVTVAYIQTVHRTASSADAAVELQNQKTYPEDAMRETSNSSENVLLSSDSKSGSHASQKIKEQIANVIEEQIKSIVQLNDVMAILKLKFSVVDVEIVTAP